MSQITPDQSTSSNGQAPLTLEDLHALISSANELAKSPSDLKLQILLKASETAYCNALHQWIKNGDKFLVSLHNLRSAFDACERTAGLSCKNLEMKNSAEMLSRQIKFHAALVRTMTDFAKTPSDRLHEINQRVSHQQRR